MKIALIILVVVVCFLLFLLLLPLTVDLFFEDKLVLKIKYSGITIFDSQKKSDLKKSEKSKKKHNIKSETNKSKEENFFKKIYNQKGMLGAVRCFSEIIILFLKKIRWILRYFRFRKFKLDLCIATQDAADTAINYGMVCGAIYPLILFLDTNTDFKAKEINIYANFDKEDSKFQLSMSIKTILLFWFIAVISAFLEFLKLQHEESEKYERK